MTDIFTIDGVPVEIGKRYWYEGHKNVSRDNRAGPGIYDHPMLEATVVERIPGGAVEKGNLVIKFDTPQRGYREDEPVGQLRVGVFQAADGKLYAGHWSYYNFDGFVDPCNFYGLYSSKEKRHAKWPALRR